MYLGRVEGGAGGSGAHQPKLAVNPDAEILELAAHAQAVWHRLLLDVEILNTRGVVQTHHLCRLLRKSKKLQKHDFLPLMLKY
jgi:hypothetical protein